MCKFSHSLVCTVSLLVVYVACEVRRSSGKSDIDDRSRAAAFKSRSTSTLNASSMTSQHRSRRSIKLTEREKQAIVDKHNYYRRREGASNMKKMRWNQFLADMATEWVSDCIFKHGHPLRRQKDLPFKYVGQNICRSTGAENDLVSSIDRYFEEKKNFNYGKNACKAGKICGHYTQVVWSCSTDIGCGVARCNSSKEPWWYCACNYGPAGNYVGQKPYEKGPACSKCNGTQLCDDGLCKK